MVYEVLGGCYEQEGEDGVEMLSGLLYWEFSNVCRPGGSIGTKR
jgi:hypothetical protein